MPLHESAKAMIDMMNASGMALDLDDPVKMRAAMQAASALLEPHPVHDVHDRVLDTQAGAVRVRVYRPSDAPELPALVWLHGGGWVLGGLDSHDQTCRMLCDATSAVVVSVDYRLAPEWKFPAAVDDCVATWEWMCEHAAEVGADSARLALGGDSAGGNLAAVTCITAREQGLPQPRLQLLVYPVTDHEFESASMLDNATGYYLEADHMRAFYAHYARTAADVDDWRMSPMRAPDLAGLAPALVVTAEFDPLRDQGEAYAEKLAAAGTPVDVVRIEGGFHGCFAMPAFVEPAREPWERAVAAVRAALGVG